MQIATNETAYWPENAFNAIILQFGVREVVAKKGGGSDQKLYFYRTVT